MNGQRTRILHTRLLAAVIAVGAGAGATSVAAEHTWREFKDVSNTSFVESSGDRAIQLSIDVAAPPHEVFAAFATSAGFSSWAAPVAQVDLRIGGFIEASYDSHARIGDPGNIRNEIVGYLPDRLLVIRNVQAPPGFADPELFRRTATVIEFAPRDASHTRVTLTNAGYGQGERWDTLYRHFEWGDAFTLAELKARFDKGPVNWTALESKRKTEASTSTVEGKN